MRFQLQIYPLFVRQKYLPNLAKKLLILRDTKSVNKIYQNENCFIIENRTKQIKTGLIGSIQTTTKTTKKSI